MEAFLELVEGCCRGRTGLKKRNIVVGAGAADRDARHGGRVCSLDEKND
jgi:hypothetical protein